MYLRKLILSGFKSFADKLELEFEPGVTLIVGPNGCGKSNIADAARWILGEHNPRKLRGMRMEDLIFNGSETRPPLGMAQATLVFDNTDGFLPVSYSEVAITRKLFRDGESHLFLNGTPCRLKDITDLFLDSGIGANTYSLIEQGRVDMIVNARPEERREIIEEAAGISRYLRRQHEALRKLEKVENDLVVINNVIGELDRQKRSLERQAKQADRAHRYRRELKIAEAILERRRGRKLLDDVAQVNGELDSLGDRAARLHDRLDALRSQKTDRLRTAQNLDAQARESRDTYLQLTNRLEQTEKQIETLRARAQEHRQLAARFQAEVKSNQERSQEEGRRVLLADKEIAKISSNLAALRHEVDQAEKEMVLAEERCRRIAFEGEEQKASCDQIQRLLTEYRDRIRNWEQQQQFHRLRLENLAAQRNQALEDLGTYRQHARKLEEESSGVRAAVSDLIHRLEKLNSDLEAAQEQRDACIRDRHQVESAWQEKYSRLESLLRLHNSLEGFGPGVRFLLRERSEPAQGLICTLAERISVEKGFERAVETALARELEGIVAEDLTAIRQAVDLLNREDRGRVAFLAKTRASRAEIQVPDRLRHLCHMPSVIQANGDMHELVERLAGRCLVATDFEEGLRYWDHLPDGWRIVTRAGEILEAGGVIVAGAVNGPGLLSRAAEIERLRQETAELATRREEIAACVTALRETVDQIARERDDIRDRKLSAETKLRHILEDLDRATGRIEHAESDLAVIDKEVEQIEQTLSSGTQEQEECQNKIQQLVREENLVKEELTLWETQMKSAQEAGRDIQTKLADLRLRLLEQQKDCERWAEQKETLARHLQELASDMEEKRELIQQEERRAAELRTRIEVLEEQLVGLRREREQTKIRIEQIDCQLREIHSQIETLQREEASLLEDLGKLDEERNNLQQQRVRLTVEKEYWERRIREMFDGEIPRDLRDQDTRSDEEIEQLAATLRRRLERIGVINELAVEEYEEVGERHDFLVNQRDDLEKAKSVLLQTTKELHGTAVDKFLSTLAQVQQNFNSMFRKMFGGGRAEIRLLDGDPIETGLEIEVQPPGKKLQSMRLLSGGEKSLVAIALLFAIYQIKPSPFCILDEVDAALDDPNISRFTSLLETFTDRSQFILITHNKHTMQIADVIYGVTMQEEGVSTVVSMRLGETPRPSTESTGEPERAGDSGREADKTTSQNTQEEERSILEPEIFDTPLVGRGPTEPAAAVTEEQKPSDK